MIFWSQLEVIKKLLNDILESDRVREFLEGLDYWMIVALSLILPIVIATGIVALTLIIGAVILSV